MRQLMAGLVAASLVLTGHGVAQPARAAATLDISRCQVSDETAFRNEIERLTLAALEQGLAGVDYDAVVADVWRSNGLDLVLDTETEKAVAAIRDESSWGALLQTLTSKEASQKLAEAVAERTYRSDATKAAIETLAGSVGRELGGHIELATLDAALPAVTCVRAFLGQRFGSTITLLVANDTGRAFEIDAAAAKAEVGTGDVVISGKGLVAGAVVLIVRRSVSRMASRIGQRVVGAVVGRLVAVVAGGVGLVLIAKDIWDFRHGVLPIIETEMKSAETKEKIRTELAAAISEQLSTHLREAGSSAADRILAVWRDFRVAHAKVVGLAERNKSFRSFVDSVDGAALPKVSRVVALVLPKEGEAGVLARVADGTLDEAVKRLPDTALAIAEDQGSLAEGIAWARLAGPDIARVAEYELHRLSKPADFTAAGLRQLLALKDPAVIKTLARRSEADRATLAELPPQRLVPLVRALDDQALGALVRYRRGLEPAAGTRLLEAAASDPKLMQGFAKGHVEHAVLASRDQSAAVAMLIERGPLFDLVAIERDVRRVVNGDVHPLLLWERHPASVIGAAIGLLILLMILRRLLFTGRRPPPLAEAGAG